MNQLAQARAALRRDRPSEALVFLWNAVEPARLAGDAGALRSIGGLAERIAQSGDEAERREAERLLEQIRGVARHETAVPATEEVGAEVSVGGTTVGAEPTIADALEGRDVPLEEEFDVEDEAPEASRGARLMNIVWLLIALGVVALNVIRGLGD